MCPVEQDLASFCLFLSRKSGFQVPSPNFLMFGLNNLKTGQIKYIHNVDLAFKSLSCHLWEDEKLLKTLAPESW